MITAPYTTQLGAGLGAIDETLVLLELWQPSMDGQALLHAALQSGRFPNMSARRLRNLVTECFAPRYLVDQGRPACLLQQLAPALARRELQQVLFVYTCRANGILADFVREVYWCAYTSGRDTVSNLEARRWVTQANQEGKTTRPWSPGMIVQVSGYLTGCSADFGLLEGGRRIVRRILPFRIEPRVAAILAYELHFAGHGDNSILAHDEWALFGLERDDVLDELKRLALRGLLIVQAAGDVARIGWPCKNLEELAHVLAQG